MGQGRQDLAEMRPAQEKPLPDRYRRAPRVSVVVAAYGVAHLLGDALASLVAQDFQDWEAIVVDDGTPDDIVTAFEPFAADRRFRLLRTDNQGVSIARNRAIAASSGRFIALLDGDDIYEPDFLGRMLAAIEADPSLAFVSCDATIFRAGEPHRSYSSVFPMAGAISLERVLSRDVMIFVATIIRRDALEQVGGFDGRLRYVEDLDLWVRLLAAGWKGAILPEVLTRYRRRPNSLTTHSRAMCVASCAVYRKAVAALEGRPEQAVAERLLRAHEQRLRWEDGKDLVLSGDLATGLPLLAGAERRSLRWRVAMTIMRRAPWLATALLQKRARLRLPHPSCDASANDPEAACPPAAATK